MPKNAPAVTGGESRYEFSRQQNQDHSTRRCRRRELLEEASMQRRILNISLCTFFAALIAVPVVIRYVSQRNESIGAATYSDTVTARYGFRFQEVAKAAGIAFTHQAPT